MRSQKYISRAKAAQAFPNVPVEYWARNNLIPRSPTGHVERAYLEGLSRYIGIVKPHQMHARLYALALDCKARSGSRPQAAETITQLLTDGQVLTTRDAATLLGYHPMTINGWVRKGFLPGLLLPYRSANRIKTVNIFRYQDVLHIKLVVDSLTSYEVAQRLDIAKGSVDRLARAGRIKATMTPLGWRFSPDSVDTYSTKTTHQHDLTRKKACELLGVSEAVLKSWVEAGHVPFVVGEKGHHLYNKAALLHVKAACETIHGDFAWLPATAQDRNYTTKSIARKLDISITTVIDWAQENLLPYFSMGPPGSQRLYRRYVAAYIDAFLQFCGQRQAPASRQLAREFKETMRQRYTQEP